MKTKLNPHIWLIILFSFIIIFTKNIMTGEILYFLHPKMLPYIYFALILFIILFIERLFKLITSKTKAQPIKWSVLIFVIPIVLSFNKPSALTGQTLNNRSKDLGIKKENTKILDSTATQKPTTEISTKTTPENDNLEIEINSELQAEAQNILEGTTPTIADDSTEFMDKIFKVQSNMDEIKGTEMTIKGFVFKDETLKDNQLIVARLYVSCCAADAGIIGILVEAENVDDFENETWINVTGTIDNMPYHDEIFNADYDIPLLKNATIEKTEPLKSMYVFE